MTAIMLIKKKKKIKNKRRTIVWNTVLYFDLQRTNSKISSRIILSIPNPHGEKLEHFPAGGYSMQGESHHLIQCLGKFCDCKATCDLHHMHCIQYDHFFISLSLIRSITVLISWLVQGKSYQMSYFRWSHVNDHLMRLARV